MQVVTPGRGGQIGVAPLPGADSLEREGDWNPAPHVRQVLEQHGPPRLTVASDWVSLSPPLPCPPAYVVERERKTEDTGCQAALAACWAALCCCCLLESLD